MKSWARQWGRIAVRDECTGTEQWGLGGTRALNQALAPLAGFGELFLSLQFREWEGTLGWGITAAAWGSSLVIYSVMDALS